MEIHEPYIPKEYLALKINYIKQQLAELPEVKHKTRKIHGKMTEVYITGTNVYSFANKACERTRTIYFQREDYLRELSRLEGLWNSAFRGQPPVDIKPQKIIRKLYKSTEDSVVIDRKFFDSLKNDADPNYRENKTFFYNGTYYRSAAEVEIARFYTEQGIPFKYEPEIWLKGLKYPIYTDFVLWIEELDLCKFHEHFGMKNSANYNRITATKYINYSEAGLQPELDIFYTYNADGVPFDPRQLHTKLNSVIYNSLFVTNP